MSTSYEEAWLTINTLRGLAIDAVEAAGSGHPGLPLGAAPVAYALWQTQLRFDPAAPRWPDRDRFVLSPGHGSALLYGLLHVYGYDLGQDDLRAFRQWGSRTPGHPERLVTPGVEATTGPLGQGTALAVGMAIAERHLARRFNRPGFPVFDHRTWALVSDGDLMEGIAAEAVSLAGHLGLGRLNFVYDANDITLDGPLSLSFSENVAARFEAAGWQVLQVERADTDLAALLRALASARDETERPTLVVCHTTIGWGSPNKAGKAAAHGSPLGPEEAVLTKQALGLDPKALFHVSRRVTAHCAQAAGRGRRAHEKWQRMLEDYRQAHPEPAGALERAMENSLTEGWKAALPRWQPGQALATRAAGGEVIGALAAHLPELIGGDADLSCSTKTTIPGGGSFDGREGTGRNIHYGVREHAMGAIANGIACHGGLRPFVSTFLAFSDYMRTPVRLAALDRLPVIFVWTHDSIGVGEDGPTHQPVEQVLCLRAIPDLAVIRPADANETAAAWAWALESARPTALILSRQALPVLESTAEAAAEGVARGAYVLAEAEGGEPEGVLMASGSEVHLAVEARRLLAEQGHRLRVVSMPCLELFDEQPTAYRDQVLPPRLRRRVSIEAGRTIGWHRLVGEGGRALGVDRFGASAPGPVVQDKLGITAQAMVRAWLETED
ncbi:MAG: transketolase [Acidobacteriota bacterium]|nr:transketolase [Acidobacteriota bacterium]